MYVCMCVCIYIYRYIYIGIGMYIGMHIHMYLLPTLPPSHQEQKELREISLESLAQGLYQAWKV